MPEAFKLPMQTIDVLKLENFRLYKKIETRFDPGINIILGDNAQGKTSLIEAIYTLCLTKSHKSPTDYNLIRQEASFSRIYARGHRDKKPITLELILSKEGKKARYNKIESKRLSDYVGIMKAVMFAPEDLNLIKGSPSERRRFIDLELSQMDRHYVYHLNQYRKHLKERNEQLKRMQKQKSHDQTLLSVLTEQLSHYAKKVVQKRQEFVAALAEVANKIYVDLSKEDILKVSYEPSIEENFLQAFNARQTQDIAIGTTTLGPHRDDCGFYFESMPVKNIASQGQIRTIALALKMAVIELLNKHHDITPIILLDDVFSELDSKRQQSILSMLDNKAQIFITTTSLNHLNLETLNSYQIIHIKSGTIEGVDTHESSHL